MRREELKELEKIKRRVEAIDKLLREIAKEHSFLQTVFKSLYERNLELLENERKSRNKNRSSVGTTKKVT